MLRTTLTVLLLLVGCSDSYRITLRFEDFAQRERTDQVEVAVVESCRDVDVTAPPVEPRLRVVVRADEATDALGKLPSGTYGLQARAVDDTCTVIAAGCSPIEVRAGKANELVVTLANTSGSSCAPSLCTCGGLDASVDASDSGVDSGLDAGPDAGCVAPRLECGPSCVNPESDPANCGSCGVMCESGAICFERACRRDACTDALGVPCDEVLGDYFKASNTGEGDLFGFAVGLSGDTLAVGARAEDSASTVVNGDQADDTSPGRGAVYVFRRTAGSWSQEAYVKPSMPGGQGFGRSLSLREDTLAVGSPDTNGVYVFHRTGVSWTEQAHLTPSHPDAGDSFGAVVSLDGDTLVVAAPGDDSDARGIDGDEESAGATNSGAAYVFHRSGATWSQEAYIKASNTGANNEFGTGLSLSEDTLAVGAPRESSVSTGIDGFQGQGGSIRGAVYVFHRTGTTWSQQVYIKAATADTGDNFGSTVSLSGDTLAVGAFGEDSAAVGVNADASDNSEEDSGAAYVFQRAGDVWSQQAYIKSSNPEFEDNFGSTVNVVGDTLVVTAKSEDSAATGINGDQMNNTAGDAGAVYLFRRVAGIWTQRAYIKAFNTGYEDYFGFGVCIDGNTLVAGAIGELSAATGINGNRADNSAFQAGAAYTFRIAP